LIETHRDPLVKKDLTYTVVEQDKIDRRLAWLIKGMHVKITPTAMTSETSQNHPL
jgi:hypothetical protein